ncbi:hypothetical protein KCP71_23805 [Salmonella enterica subsp. enterica]|nr:hypothetical protein KCP71_23805 [Salmonella enterica subsp. enterica]
MDGAGLKSATCDFFINRDQPENRQPPRWRRRAKITLFNAIRRDVSSFRSCMPTHLVPVQARSAFTG